MKPRKVVEGGCGACARARRVLPVGLANNLAEIEARRIAKRRAAAASIAAEVPPNAHPPCEHGVPTDEPCKHCRAALDTMLARGRGARE